MDTSKTITHIGLCAGYGGIELGLHRVVRNMRTVALCEIEAFACANLVAKMEAGLMDPAPIWTDLKTFPWGEFRDRVDILTGGYPCQPFSAAGKRLGTEDPRHLWPFIADGIRILRPRMCFFENVEGHISLGLSSVISDLEELGYKVSWGIFSASEVGAPHQRKRVFILAHRDGERGFLPDQRRVAAEQVPVGDGEAWGDVMADAGSERRQQNPGGPSGDEEAHGGEGWNEQQPHGHHLTKCHGQGNVWPSRPGEPQHGWEPTRVVGNASPSERWPDNIGRSRQADEKADFATASGGELADTESPIWRRTSGEDNGRRRPAQAGGSDGGQSGNGQAQPPLGGDAHGPSSRLGYAELCVSTDNRTDELRLLGNGVVPATAASAFLTLIEELNQSNFHDPAGGGWCS